MARPSDSNRDKPGESQDRPDYVIYQADLRKELGVSSETIRRWKRDGKLPKPDVAITMRTLGWRLSTLHAAGIGVVYQETVPNPAAATLGEQPDQAAAVERVARQLAGASEAAEPWLPPKTGQIVQKIGEKSSSKYGLKYGLRAILSENAKPESQSSQFFPSLKESAMSKQSQQQSEACAQKLRNAYSVLRMFSYFKELSPAAQFLEASALAFESPPAPRRLK